MADKPQDLATALRVAQNQGLISIRGMERDLGISRNTARAAIRGSHGQTPETAERIWHYLKMKGARL